MADITEDTVRIINENSARALADYTFSKNSLVYKRALSAMINRFDNEIIKTVFRMETEEAYSRDPVNPAFGVVNKNIDTLRLCRDALADAFDRAQDLSPDDDEGV